MVVPEVQAAAPTVEPVEKAVVNSTVTPLENETPPELDGPIQPDQTRVAISEAHIPEKLEQKIEEKKAEEAAAQPEELKASEPEAQAEPEVTVESVIEKLAASLNFSVDDIKTKYAEERDKRVRPDGNQQYKEFKGQFSHYLNDPYMPQQPREALDVETDFLVLGAGFGGLCLAAELTKAGIKDFKIIDKAGDFGGTWYWNRYPGAACDIEAYIYMPLLEETNYIPTEKYAKAPELLEHSRRIGRHFDLYSRALFHTEVRAMDWNEESGRWIIKTDRGDTIRARFAASASGPLNMPKLPGVPGIETFKGHSFHTSRWDYEYTGGDLYGNLDKLGDKRVGFIGTGATAIQAVPHLGAGVQKGENGRLFVFQRTPSSVGWRDNKKTEPGWGSDFKPGWQLNRQENFLRVMAGSQEEDQVMDGWTSYSRWLKAQGLPATADFRREYGKLIEFADMQNMQRIRTRCDEVVKDQDTAAALKPWYRQFCKRPCFHDEYLDTYNHSNVTLVDTNGQGIERITEKGIVANGKEYELDCIVYGTGFEVGTSYARRSNFEIVGRDGNTMTNKWSEGVRTLHGFWMHNFPNLFIISTTHSGYAANFVYALHRQAEHVAWIVKNLQEQGITQLEATQEAEDGWTETIVGMYRFTAEYQRTCTPGYYNLEGQITDSLPARRTQSYGGGPLAFFKLIKEWRDAGAFEGLAFKNDKGEEVKISNPNKENVDDKKPDDQTNGSTSNGVEQTPTIAVAA